MRTSSNPLLTAVTHYLRFIPILIIPVAGIVFMMTVGPYAAVAKGCRMYKEPRPRELVRFALTFSILISTTITLILIVLASVLAPAFMIHQGEAAFILLIYIVTIIFSQLGARAGGNPSRTDK